jgi:hypothetical protein
VLVEPDAVSPQGAVVATAVNQIPAASVDIPPQTVASRVVPETPQVLLLQPKLAGAPITRTHHAVIRIPDVSDAERANHPPRVDLGAMGDGVAVLMGDSVLFSARVMDPQDRPQNLRLRWVSDIDGEFHTGAPDSYGRVRFRHVLPSAGEHRVTLYATDTEGLIGRSHVNVVVSLTPKPDVVLTPELPNTSEHLIARVRGPSLREAASYMTFSYQWYVDGELSGASSSSTLPASATRKGQTWRVVVNPPSSALGWEKGEDTVVIQNAPPTVSGVDVRLSDTSVTSSLSCVPGTGSDADADPVEYSYTWEVNNIPIIGESNTVLDRAFFSMGGSVACIVTPFDGESTGASLRSREVNVIRPSSTIEPDKKNCRFGRRCR